MKQLLLTLLVSSVCLSSGAQNYQCLQPGVKHYFTNGDGYLRGIRIDSVRTYADSTIYYPFHTPRGRYHSFSGGGAIFDSTGSSWVGGRVLAYADGTFLFNTFLHDTVVIKTQANVGDSWVFYNDTTALYYRADVIANDTMTVAGSMDSIKRILITARNASGIVAGDPVDSFQMVLSKDHGFVQVFDLFMFPYHTPDSATVAGLDYYLDQVVLFFGGSVSKSNSVFLLSDFPDPSGAELTQWHVGDVYESGSCNNICEFSTTFCDPASMYDFDTIIAVTTTSSGIQFSYSGWLAIADDHFNYVFAPNAGMFNLTNSPVIGYLMPEEYLQPNLIFYKTDSSFCVPGRLYELISSELIGNTYHPYFEATPVTTMYKAPFGLVYNEWGHYGACSSMAGPDFTVNGTAMLWYSRGDTVCGTIKYPDGVPQVKQNVAFIKLYPNPATNELIVSASEDISSVVMSDITGRVMGAFNGNRKELRIDVRGLTTGVYLVRINGTEVREFVKE